MESGFDKALFAKRLREIRKSKGLTQEELCELAGIDVSNYCKMETAKVSPSLQSLFKLVCLAKFDPNELFDFEHMKDEESLDEIILEIFQKYSPKQKQFLYKFMRSLEEYNS